MKEQRKSIWVQIFLAYKYLNKYFNEGVLSEYKITPYDYFLLMSLRVYENYSFYELNKYMPIDSKSLHTKVNSYVEKGLMNRQYDETGTSNINLTDKSRTMIRDIYYRSFEGAEDHFKEGELLGLHSSLNEFNEKMRRILELELPEHILEKINLELL